ncbi:hypothetical protein T11_2475, partial [Trichinella zimbabwensis]
LFGLNIERLRQICGQRCANILQIAVTSWKSVGSLL